MSDTRPVPQEPPACSALPETPAIYIQSLTPSPAPDTYVQSLTPIALTTKDPGAAEAEGHVEFGDSGSAPSTLKWWA
jgi:hypothetical protein